MVGEDLIGSSRKRQHSKKVKSSAWQTLWDKLEGWSDEQNEMDLSAQQLIKRTYTGKNQKSALDKYQALREEGWGSHETLVKLIKGEFKELFESLPESFDWKPEGSIAQ